MQIIIKTSKEVVAVYDFSYCQYDGKELRIYKTDGNDIGVVFEIKNTDIGHEMINQIFEQLTKPCPHINMPKALTDAKQIVFDKFKRDEGF